MELGSSRLTFVVLAAALPLLTACNTTSGQAGRAGGPRQSVAVETTNIKRISVQREIDLSGTLQSPDQAKVSSEVAGVVREVPVELGREVKKGDVLVRLEPRELELAMDRAESALRQVEAQLGITRTQDKEPPPDEEIDDNIGNVVHAAGAMCSSSATGVRRRCAPMASSIDNVHGVHELIVG